MCNDWNWIIAALISLVIAFPSKGWSEDSPAIYCESASYDFGPVSNSGYYDHSFIITNDTNEAAKILDHKSSCGCTIVSLTSDVIPPQGTLEVPVRLKDTGRTGPFTGMILVQVERLDKPIELTINADFPKLESDFYLFPRQIVFTDVVVDRKDTEILLVKRKDDSPLGPIEVTSDTPLVEVVSVDPMTSPDGVQYAAARVRAVKGEPGTEFSAVITVQGEGGGLNKASCPVEGNFVGVNQTYPNGFLLNLIGRESVYQPLEVSNALGEPIAIASVELDPSNSPGEVTLKKIHDAKWELRYEVDAEAVPTDNVEGKVIVKFEDKNMTPLTIPVYIMK